MTSTSQCVHAHNVPPRWKMTFLVLFFLSTIQCKLCVSVACVSDYCIFSDDDDNDDDEYCGYATITRARRGRREKIFQRLYYSACICSMSQLNVTHAYGHTHNDILSTFSILTFYFHISPYVRIRVLIPNDVIDQSFDTQQQRLCVSLNSLWTGRKSHFFLARTRLLVL